MDKTKLIPIKLFVKGDPSHRFGLYPYRCAPVRYGGQTPAHLSVGADSIGRDMFARTLIGGQVSMTVGLVGVALSIVLGSVLGTISGYYMGIVDDIIQRIIEVIIVLSHDPAVGCPGRRAAANI